MSLLIPPNDRGLKEDLSGGLIVGFGQH